MINKSIILITMKLTHFFLISNLYLILTFDFFFCIFAIYLLYTHILILIASIFLSFQMYTIFISTIGLEKKQHRKKICTRFNQKEQ